MEEEDERYPTEAEVDEAARDDEEMENPFEGIYEEELRQQQQSHTDDSTEWEDWGSWKKDPNEN